MSNQGIKDVGQRWLVYTLLVLGSTVFCWPLLWMASSSVKAGSELFARKQHFFPETPAPALRSPFVDHNAFPDLLGQRQGEMLGWLEEAIRPQMPALASDLDPAEASVQMARGAYLRLSDSLPSSVWTLPAAELKAVALKAVDRPLLEQLLSQVRRALVVSTLTARSYDVQEDILAPGDKVTGAWKLEVDGGAKVSLVQGAQGADLHYDLSQGERIRLSNTFKTSFPIDRLYRVQMSVKADRSWNRLRVFVEKQGKLYESVRDLPMADANWTEYCWQEPGPDELTNKIRTWVLLKPIAEGSQYESGPQAMKVVVELERNDLGGAWSEKIKRNFQMVFDNIPFWRYVATSLFLVALNLLGTLLSCSLVAYSFARLNWPGRSMSYGLMLATMMVPAQVTMIPFFLIIRYLNWYNTLYPLWVCSFCANAFNVFLLHQFFKGIPKDLEDAAKIDGCGPLRSYWYIMLPLVRPSLATVAVFTFLGVWNDFMGPLIYLGDQRLYPLSLGLYALQLQSDGSTAMVMAGSLLMILPVVAIFFFAQRYFIQGIAMTGMKG
jgi:multiple sugar transport system permease protein